MSEIWVLAEQKGGKFKKVTFELLGKARALAAARSMKVAAVVLGESLDFAQQLKPFADRLYLLESPHLKEGTYDASVEALSEAIGAHKPELVLVPGTSRGKDMAPRLAARTGAALVTDCLDLEWRDRFVATKAAMGEKVLQRISFSDALKMATVRPNILPPIDAGSAHGSAEVVKLSPSIKAESVRTRLVEFIEGAKTVELTEAEIIVSGGRGMKSGENFKILEELATELGAAVGASRSAVDAGWRPHSFQVGQTGKSVSPKLYVACGISGAVQHLAGISRAKTIVAINKDPDAPIFKVADYGIVADLFQVVPLLTEEMKKLKSGQ